MDPWKELAAREECRDAVRAWAELENNRRPVADDGVPRYTLPAQRTFNWRIVFGVAAKLAAWLYESWWHLTRR